MKITIIYHKIHSKRFTHKDVLMNSINNLIFASHFVCFLLHCQDTKVNFAF